MQKSGQLALIQGRDRCLWTAALRCKMRSACSHLTKQSFCLRHENLHYRTAEILSVALWEWQTWLVSFSSMDSSPGLLINRDFFFFWDVFQMLQIPPFHSHWIWLLSNRVTPGLIKCIPVKSWDSPIGTHGPCESRLCDWQDTSTISIHVCVCDFLLLSSGAPCLAGSCPKPFLWRWFSWKRRWPDSPQPPHSRTLRLSQHWALVGSEEWSL